ncbi:hypothetical protein B484DRAFT_407884 [Ochromonadaceae sp. CCMP2298]|nr:hypothetical protein B484DRAFT_407884 [Ochromonadaceae sp. CCMP2298]
MRTKKPATGHTPRHTLCTNAVNNGVTPAVFSITSKHKGMGAFLGDVKPDDGLLLQTALGIGTAVRRSVKGARSAYASYVENSEAEGEEEAEELEVEADKENNAAAGTPTPKQKGQGKGTPGRGEKRQRAGTPLRPQVKRADTPVRKRVQFEDQESPEDEELQRVTEENAKISISHSDMRAVCVRDRPHAQGSSSSSSSSSSSMVYDVDAETYEEGRNIHIHIHRGGR